MLAVLFAHEAEDLGLAVALAVAVILLSRVLWVLVSRDSGIDKRRKPR